MNPFLAGMIDGLEKWAWEAIDKKLLGKTYPTLPKYRPVFGDEFNASLFRKRLLTGNHLTLQTKGSSVVLPLSGGMELTYAGPLSAPMDRRMYRRYLEEVSDKDPLGGSLYEGITSPKHRRFLKRALKASKAELNRLKAAPAKQEASVGKALVNKGAKSGLDAERAAAKEVAAAAKEEASRVASKAWATGLGALGVAGLLGGTLLWRRWKEGK